MKRNLVLPRAAEALQFCLSLHPEKLTSTPWKIDMEPKNEGLEDDVPFQKDDSEVSC